MDARFAYTKTAKTGMKTHEKLSILKTLSEVETFEKFNLLCKYHENGSESATEVYIYPEAFLCKCSPTVNN